jgi:ketosteroid isomerase-like protein
MSELTGEDFAAIQEIHDRWLRAELQGDHFQVIELCTDDVSWIPPDAHPLNGKEAIARYLAENAVELKDIQVKDVVIRGNGSVAYLIGYYHTWFKLPVEAKIQDGKMHDTKIHDAKIHESTGAHLWILRRTEDGTWQVAIVSWSYW